MSEPVTLAKRMAQTRGFPAGFDYLRIILSTCVLSWHTVLMSHGFDFQNELIDHSPYRAAPCLILPMFFALSGFLVAGSLERTKNIFDFLCLRLLRIFPALCLVVICSAAILGPLVTDLPLDQYYSDPGFARYFLTIFGDIQLNLPGVFSFNPFPTVVNGQLWTIPVELECYIFLCVCALIGAVKRPVFFLGIVVLGQLAFAGRAMFGPHIIYGGVPPRVLIICFAAGVLIHIYREKIPCRRDLAIFCGLMAAGLIYLPGGAYFLALPAAYVTIYLGLKNPRKIWLVSSGDYSYGMYLFAFPVQQLVASNPLWADKWYANLFLSIPITFLLSFLSWHLLEKRFLALRKKIPQLNEWLHMRKTKMRGRWFQGRVRADKP